MTTISTTVTATRQGNGHGPHDTINHLVDEGASYGTFEKMRGLMLRKRPNDEVFARITLLSGRRIVCRVCFPGSLLRPRAASLQLTVDRLATCDAAGRAQYEAYGEVEDLPWPEIAALHLLRDAETFRERRLAARPALLFALEG